MNLFIIIKNTSNRTLLATTIVEGGADFITELVLGPTDEKLDYRVFGEKNEKQIWQEFKQNFENKNHKNWIAVVDNEKKAAGWPADLSYFIGYKIAKGYYENSEDKRQAVKDLLRIEDPYRILEISKYGSF